MYWSGESIVRLSDQSDSKFSGFDPLIGNGIKVGFHATRVKREEKTVLASILVARLMTVVLAGLRHVANGFRQAIESLSAPLTSSRCFSTGIPSAERASVPPVGSHFPDGCCAWPKPRAVLYRLHARLTTRQALPRRECSGPHCSRGTSETRTGRTEQVIWVERRELQPFSPCLYCCHLARVAYDPRSCPHAHAG